MKPQRNLGLFIRTPGAADYVTKYRDSLSTTLRFVVERATPLIAEG